MSHMTVQAVFRRTRRSSLLLIVLLVLALYAVLPQLGSFHSAWHILLHATLPEALLAIVFTVLTYVAAAATYWLLAFERPPLSQLVLVQLAAMFINRLLPGGIGALGVNYAYLRRHQHRAAQAVSVITLNNLLGVLGHGLVVAITLLAFSNRVSEVPRRSLSVSIILEVIGAVLLLIMGALLAGRVRFVRFLHDIRSQLTSYRLRPVHLSTALLTSVALTLCNVLSLSTCALALGVHIPFVAVVLVFTFGVGAGTVTPTPGGLGGFEAGLVAGFVAYHVPAATALALALLYRLISYWLPFIAGAVAFGICQRRRLFTA